MDYTALSNTILKALKDAGCYNGELDGIIGRGARAAFLRFDQESNAARATPGTENHGAGAAILVTASKFMGLVETRPNNKWDLLKTPGEDEAAEELRSELLKIGWGPGYAYCIAGVEVVWRQAYAALGRADVAARVGKLLTLGVVDSYNRIKAAGLAATEPVPGAICFLQSTSKPEQGHAFIVRGKKAHVLTTYEFNTSPGATGSAQEREGGGNFARSRTLPVPGFRLLGYLNPL